MKRIASAVIFLVFSNTAAPGATRECAARDFDGSWKNIREETKTLAALDIRGTCDSENPHGAIAIRALETCRPRKCTWGWVGGRIDAEGVLVANFQTFTAKRRIMVLKQGLRLRVLVETDYISDQRESTRESYILVRSAD